MIGNHLPATPLLPAAVQAHRIGVMHCCWGKLDWATHCRLSRAVGGSYVETFAGYLKPENGEAATFRAQREAAGIDLLAVIADHLACVDPAKTAEALKPQIARWREVGLSTYVVLRSGRDQDFSAFLKTLEACAAVVRAAGLTPVTQNHVKGRVESPEELLACREVGVPLHFDTQQFAMTGHAPLVAWDLVGRHVRHVHLGDRDAKGEATPFGAGAIQMGELLRRMHATGYRGALTLETEYGPRDEGTESIVRQAHDFVRQTLEPLGAVGTKPPGHAVLQTGALGGFSGDWGTLRWIAQDGIFAGCGQTVGLVTIAPGKRNPRHAHPSDHEIIYVRSGTCLHHCGDRAVRLVAGDVLHIPPGQPHCAENDGSEDLDMIVCYPTGARSFEAHDTETE